MKKYFDGYASFDWNEMSKDKLVSELIRKCKYISELKTQLATENQKAIIVLKKVKRYVDDKDLDVVKYIDNQIKEYGKEDEKRKI